MKKIMSGTMNEWGKRTVEIFDVRPLVDCKRFCLALMRFIAIKYVWMRFIAIKSVFFTNRDLSKPNFGKRQKNHTKHVAESM